MRVPRNEGAAEGLELGHVRAREAVGQGRELALVVGGIGLSALTGMATGISFLFMGVVFAGGAMFFRGMRGGSF